MPGPGPRISSAPGPALGAYAYVIENGEIRTQGDAATMREDESIVQAYLGVA